MDNSNTLAATARKAAIMAVTVSAALMTPPAQAQQHADSSIEHFIECAGLLLSDPLAHANNCLPNRVPPTLESLVDTGSDGPVAPPPPLPDPVESVDCGPVDCGPDWPIFGPGSGA